MTDLAIYVPEKLKPPVQDILAGVLKQFPSLKDIELWNEFTDRTVPMLALCKAGEIPEALPITWVRGLTQPQILASPAALTELTASIEQLVTPFDWPEVPYAVVDMLTDEEVKGLGKVLVVDIETGGTVQSDLPEDSWLLSLAIYDGKNCYVYTEESMQEDTLDNARQQLIDILTSGRKLVAHNAKFDFRSLNAFLGTKVYGHLDTMLLHHAINPGGKEHDLKNTCRKYLGAPDWDAEIKKWLKNSKIGYEQIPRELLYHYNAGDVIWTWRLMKYLAKAAEGENRIATLARRETGMGNFYQDIENNAASVDLAHLAALGEKYTTELVPLREKLQDMAGNIGPKNAAFNPGSHAQVKAYFLARGVSLKSTDEQHLEDLREKGTTPKLEEFIDTLLEYRGLSKLNDTYIKGIAKRLHHGNRVYPTFLVHGTNTGRLSSKNPNIQNIPREKELRRLFISRDPEERTVLNVDYSQAELRVMAALSEDPYLMSLFQADSPDFFDALMPSAYPNENIAEWAAGDAKDKRADLKGVIYGMSYGRKAPAIAKALGMPVKAAQAIITNYFLAAPVLYDWRMWVSEVAIDPESTLVSPYGRYYQSEIVTGRNKQNVVNSGLAFLPQSTASDMCVDAAMATHKWIHEYDAFIWATVHDSIMIDTPKKYVEEIAERVKEEMVKAGQKVFGDKVLFAAEASWGRSWGEAD